MLMEQSLQLMDQQTLLHSHIHVDAQELTVDAQDLTVEDLKLSSVSKKLLA